MKQVNVMHAITWAEVKESTIMKCFARTGFSGCQSSAEDHGEDQVVQHTAAVKSIAQDITGCSFQEFVSIDDELNTGDSDVIDWSRPAQDIYNKLNSAECLRR